MRDPYHKETLENTMGFMKNGAAYPDHYDNGIMNDVEYYKVKIPFDQVKVPVHMMHGTADPDVFYTQAEQAHAGIADSILVTLENAGHTLNISPMYKEAFA